MSAEAAERLATLTPEEDRRWEQLFADYLNDGFNEIWADLLTWKSLQAEYPRLAEFDGCQPVQFSAFDHAGAGEELEAPDSHNPHQPK